MAGAPNLSGLGVLLALMSALSLVGIITIISGLVYAAFWILNHVRIV